MKAILVRYNNKQSQEIINTIDVMHYSTALPKYVCTLEDLCKTGLDYIKTKINHETYTSGKSIRSLLNTLGLDTTMERVCMADGCIYSTLRGAIEAIITVTVTYTGSDMSHEFYILCVEDTDVFNRVNYPEIIKKSINSLKSW